MNNEQLIFGAIYVILFQGGDFMENVLYEYQLNLADYIWNFIPLLVGIGFLYNSVLIIKSKYKEKGWDGFIASFFKIAGFIVAPIGIGMFLLSTIGMSIQHVDYKERLSSNDLFVIEGYVKNFHPMPYEGHDTEHFEINGVFFEYSEYTITNGYHKTASHGGVITQNGQHLKVKYVVEELEEGSENVILYIAEITD